MQVAEADLERGGGGEGMRGLLRGGGGGDQNLAFLMLFIKL